MACIIQHGWLHCGYRPVIALFSGDGDRYKEAKRLGICINYKIKKCVGDGLSYRQPHHPTPEKVATLNPADSCSGNSITWAYQLP